MKTQVITVLGAAGLGKSRLLDEFNKWADLRPETWLTFEGRATTALTNRPYRAAARGALFPLRDFR